MGKYIYLSSYVLSPKIPDDSFCLFANILAEASPNALCMFYFKGALASRGLAPRGDQKKVKVKFVKKRTKEIFYKKK